MKPLVPNGRVAANPRRLVGALVWIAFLGLAAVGCRTAPPVPAGRPFNFQQDTFAFPNELVWEYHYDVAGHWRSQPRVPPPTYSHHCFVVARSAKQFFDHARFDPAQPKLDEPGYRRLLREVIRRSPCEVSPADQKVVFPGYASLREFSADHEVLLQSECGGAWQSYFQRGHWRVVLPFSRSGQEAMSRQLVAAIRADAPPVVHLIRFPQLSINHAILLFDVQENTTTIRFSAYDPNQPDRPATLIFDRGARQFEFPANDYWPGGKLNVYEVYRGWDY